MPLPLAIGLFVVTTATVAIIGPRLTRAVGKLSRHTVLGDTIVGTVMLGATTSLPGLVVTVAAAVTGRPGLAIGNAIGGVAAQTSFLGMADLVYRKGELEKETSSAAALTQLAVFFGLLGVPLIALGGWPDVKVGWVHPASFVLIGGFALGLVLAKAQPGVDGARHEEKLVDQGEELGPAWRRYILFVVVLGVAGYILSVAVTPIAEAFGLTSVAAGGLLTALATSSPELITTLAAAREERLELAVGEVVGGNNFDLLFLAVADIAAAGSVYESTGASAVLLVGVTLVLNGLLLMNFVRAKPDRTDAPESYAMILVYVVLAVLLAISK